MQGFGLIYFIAKFLVIDNQTARDRNPSFGGDEVREWNIMWSKFSVGQMLIKLL